MNPKLFNYSKNPIPVLNSSNKPHNYAIMSALLMDSNSDHLPSSNLNHMKTTSNCHQASSSYRKMHRKFLNEKTIKHTNNHSSRTASKDLVYISKKPTKPTRSTNIHQHQLLINKNANLNLLNLENVSNTQSNFFFYNSPNASNTSGENSFTPVERPFSSSGTRLNESNSLLDESAENQVELNNEDDHELQVNGQISVPTLPEHNEQNSTNQFDSNNSKNYNETSEVVTYTISCPSDWNLNLDRMINCYCLLDKNFDKQSNFNSTRMNRIKLKCGVCELEFSSLKNLVKHKELNLSCVNELRNARSSRSKVLNKFSNNPGRSKKKIQEVEELDDDELFGNNGNASNNEFNSQNCIDFDETSIEEFEGDGDEEDEQSNFSDSSSNSNGEEILSQNSRKKSNRAKNSIKVKKKNNKRVNAKNKNKKKSQTSPTKNQAQLDSAQIKQKTRRKYVKRKTVVNVNLICSSIKKYQF